MSSEESLQIPLTPKEREVINILFSFRKLARRQPLQSFPSWKLKKKRSVLSPSDNSKMKKKEKSKSHFTIFYRRGEQRSPESPLVFSPSGGEETKASKKRKQRLKSSQKHKEWVKEQSETIASLSSANLNLRQAVEEAKSRYQYLEERNSSLKEMRSKLGVAMLQQQQQQVMNSRLDLVPATEAAGNSKRVLFTVVPDLNKKAEEGMMKWQPMERKALSAKARKRRIELQRVKISTFVSHKLPRLR